MELQGIILRLEKRYKEFITKIKNKAKNSINLMIIKFEEYKAIKNQIYLQQNSFFMN